MKIKSFAKVNIFLKIIGLRGSYHEISSRFMKVENLFDEIFFEKAKKFEIEGDFGCNLQQNTIYKAYMLLKSEYPKVSSFFENHKIRVVKNIPKFAGLGGGSSNAASFLLLSNKILDLKIPKEKLAKIGEKIGADVPFFVYEYNSANVSGIGEIVENFEEKPLKFDIITPPIKCETKMVYEEFRKRVDKKTFIENQKMAKKLEKMKSRDILENFTPTKLNDLFNPALKICKNLHKFAKEDFFFSGSGSSFFKVRDE